MKRIFTITMITLVGFTVTFGQSKKDLEIKVVEMQATIDSITSEYGSLSTIHDSTSKVLDSYLMMYKVIQEKVLPYDFNPEDLGGIIDSIRTGRDSVFTGIMAGSESLRDTISFMSGSLEDLEAKIDSQSTEIGALKAEIEELSAPPATMSDEQMDELMKIKKLMDSEILTPEEFDERKKRILSH